MRVWATASMAAAASAATKRAAVPRRMGSSSLGQALGGRHAERSRRADAQAAAAELVRRRRSSRRELGLPAQLADAVALEMRGRILDTPTVLVDRRAQGIGTERERRL